MIFWFWSNIRYALALPFQLRGPPLSAHGLLHIASIFCNTDDHVYHIIPPSPTGIAAEGKQLWNCYLCSFLVHKSGLCTDNGGPAELVEPLRDL